VDVYEDWLAFPPDLLIYVEGGQIVLQGTTYEDGVELQVNAQSQLIER